MNEERFQEYRNTLHDSLEETILDIDNRMNNKYKALEDKIDEILLEQKDYDEKIVEEVKKRVIQQHEKFDELRKSINDLKRVVAKELKLDKLIDLLSDLIDKI